MNELKSIIRLSDQIYYIPSRFSFTNIEQTPIIDHTTQKPMKLSIAEAEIFRFLLCHFQNGVSKSELEAAFPDLSNPYDRTVDRLRREKLESKLGLYGLITKHNGTVQIHLPESPFSESSFISSAGAHNAPASAVSVTQITGLSELIIRQYADTLKSIQDTGDYVSPFIPSEFSELIAKQAENITEFDRKAIADHGIDPIIYEIFLAQKIARASEQKEFKRILQLIHLTPDCWRVFVNSTMQIVGYWVFISLTANAYELFSSGKVNEKNLTIQDVRFVDMPGWYKGYLLLSGVITEHRTPPVTNMVYNSWLNTLESYSKMKIFFSEIASMVYSLGGMSSLANIGMTSYANYNYGGKMFRYQLSKIEEITYLKKYFPDMFENYRKEIQRYGDFPTD